MENYSEEFKNVIIIGGHGWLGLYICLKLLKLNKLYKNIKINLIDIKKPLKELEIILSSYNSYNSSNNSNNSNNNQENNIITSYICDISNKEELNNIIMNINPNIIFHVATLIDLRVYPSNKMDEVNIIGTNNIIDIMKNLSKDKIRYLIYTSSIDVVATSNGIRDANENTPTILLNPSNGYKRTKSTAENLVLTANYSNLCCCALRPGHIFGPGDPVCANASFIPIALGPKSARMSFTYVENAAYAHILAAIQLIKESKLSIPLLLPSSTSTLNSNLTFDYMNYPYLTKTPLFIYEFNVNFCDTYREFAGKSPSFIRIPTIFLSVIISIVEFIESNFYRLFSTHLFQRHPFLSMTSSVLEACYFLTVNSTRSQKILNYNDLELNKLFRVIDKDEAIRRTQHWVKTGEILIEE